jgi:hypothetical protein
MSMDARAQAGPVAEHVVRAVMRPAAVGYLGRAGRWVGRTRKTLKNKGFSVAMATKFDILVRAGLVSLPPARLGSPRRTLLEPVPAMTAHYPIVPGVTFKDILGFPGYCMGDNGSVWCCLGQGSLRGAITDHWRPVKGTVKQNGYLQVTLKRGGAKYTRLVHRLVLEAFVGPCPLGMEACHSPDNNRTNNCLSNLRWDTRQSNRLDTKKHGTFRAGPLPVVRGSAVKSAKLTEPQVMEIRRLLSEGISYCEIARSFGVDPTSISRIDRGQRWAHVR